jgi:hypothetical protein
MDLPRLRLAAFPVFLLLIFSPFPSWGQKKSEWYLSNAGGMAVEKAASRLAALRSPYCLLVEEGSFRDVPDLLRPYYRAPWIVELRVLYKEGKESRRQWLFRNGTVNRLVAVFTRTAGEGGDEEGAGEGAAAAGGESAGETGGETGGGEAGKEAPPLGFIEIYGERGLIVRERQFLEDGEMTIDYAYRNAGGREVLIRADARRRPLESPEGEGEPLYTDYYRYTRSYSLRRIERVFPEGGEKAAALVRFPRRSLDSEKETGFVSPVSVYGSRFLEDLQADSLQQISYTTDDRGRILTETWKDGEGNITGELRNTWSGGRLSRIEWSAGGERRAAEYDYNDEGDRFEERNYRSGVLERIVRIQGDREEEELYMNGEPILRALWEGGKKIREEQVRPGGRQPPRRGNP